MELVASKDLIVVLFLGRSRKRRGLDPLSTAFNSIMGGFGGGFPNFANMANQFSNIGTQISNMGSQIINNVNQAIQPAQAQSLMMNMMNGIGGTTVITFPNNRGKPKYAPY